LRRREPVIVIALDGAEYSLIQRWCREGYLPTISSLIDNGCWGILDSTASISSGTVWPSTNTGLSPHKHGVFYGHKEFVNGTYQIKRKYANEVNGAYFWKWLSQAGKKIAIFDIPYTYPLPELNGIQIAAWGAFSPHWKMSSWPPELMRDVVSRFGTHPLARWYERRPKTTRDYEDFCSKLLSGVEKREQVSKYLIDIEDWDLLFVAFSETHWAGHLLWHLVDERHPFYDPSLPKSIKAYVRNLYSAIDSSISRLMKFCPGATLLIYSPEGMGPNYSGNHILPEVLTRLGMDEHPLSGVQPADDPFIKRLINQIQPHRRWGIGAVRRLEELMPLNLIKMLKRFVPMRIWDSWTRRIVYAGNEWKNSKAFVIPGEYFGAIRINLKDREPNGLVESGKEYDEVCQELIERLTCLVHADTGQPAVDEVVRLDKVFNTNDVKHFPDILVKWTGDAPIKQLFSEEVGTIYGESNEVRSGAHRPSGFLTAKGDGICKGKVLTGAKIMDLAPTILYLLRQSVPPEMDGRVLIDMFDEKSQ
jgi:predicted AlkP superfamily phosphohydrolase/phosphomutase